MGFGLKPCFPPDVCLGPSGMEDGGGAAGTEAWLLDIADVATAVAPNLCELPNPRPATRSTVMLLLSPSYLFQNSERCFQVHV